ncbi:hypothetical protein L1987_72888 [Smallanthus sonchifolius]|uniref:Uncharacterized protein n=1 Tax=Smallanthus sonchifolius TaxID=185202 RepID=A0ACB9AWH3_9ASTR|nr:hypothetical protein L1987_72888 [Smallanthus sonchifolius]
MAFVRTAMITNLNTKASCALTFKRCIHAISTPPLDIPISQSAASQPLISPEFDRRVDTFDYRFVSDFPFYVNNGSMELMAVPKKKIRLAPVAALGLRSFVYSSDLSSLFYRFVAESSYLIFSAAVGLGTPMDSMVQPVDD